VRTQHVGQNIRRKAWRKSGFANSKGRESMQERERNIERDRDRREKVEREEREIEGRVLRVWFGPGSGFRLPGSGSDFTTLDLIRFLGFLV
jgi:hypothetical protein